jgi:DNA primase
MPVIVEGPLDVIAVAITNSGKLSAVAPCGTALTADQVHALNQVADLNKTGVLVAFDCDAAGRRAAISAYHLLAPRGWPTTAVLFPDGRDPAHVLREHGPAALAAMLADHTQPLADLVIDAAINQWERSLRFAEGQIGALRTAAPLVAAMPPADVGHQVARLADRLSLDHATVTEAVTDALSTLVTACPATARPSNSHDPPAWQLDPRSCDLGCISAEESWHLQEERSRLRARRTSTSAPTNGRRLV